MSYPKIIHMIWIGSGTPHQDDLRYLKMWGEMRRLGWQLYLWSNDLNRPWCPGQLDHGYDAETHIERKNFTSDTFNRGMTRLVGPQVWRELVDIALNLDVLGEAVPFPLKDITRRDGAYYELSRLKSPGGLDYRSLKEKVPVDEVARRIIDAAGWMGTDFSSSELDCGAKKKTKSWGANYAAASDIIRAGIVCLHGGFYTDISSAPMPQEGVGGLGGRAPGSSFDQIAASPGETTVLWNLEEGMVNNAFLGASKADSPFWIYYLKSMHKIYKDLIIEPQMPALETYFEQRAAQYGRRFNRAKLQAKITLAGSAKKFMYYMKRLAQRDLTLYCSGPYLLRACLEAYYVRRARNPLTVQELVTYVKSCPKGKRVDEQKRTAIEMAKTSGPDPKPLVNFEIQNVRLKKIQRGSWDQSAVADYFEDIFDPKAPTTPPARS